MAAQVHGYAYEPKNDHRDGTPKKSQWTIPEADEVGTFGRAIQDGWVQEHLAWGLHTPDGEASYLGLSPKDPGPESDLFFALFEIANPCHGYPADHRRSAREKPPVAVQRAWLAAGLLRPQVIKKIARGQRCNL